MFRAIEHLVICDMRIPPNFLPDFDWRKHSPSTFPTAKIYFQMQMRYFFEVSKDCVSASHGCRIVATRAGLSNGLHWASRPSQRP